MMVTAEAADQLKARAGVKPSGQKEQTARLLLLPQLAPRRSPLQRAHAGNRARCASRFMDLTEYQVVVVGT